MTLHRSTPALLAALSWALVLAACGTGGTETAPAGDLPGDAAQLPAARAVVTADVDGDGDNDVLSLPLDAKGDDDEEADCWRTNDAGDVERMDAWRDHPVVERVRELLESLRDDEILADHGVHDGSAPFAVLHLDRPEREEPPGDPLIDELHPENGTAGSLVGIRGHDLAARKETTSVTFDDVDAKVLVAFPGFVLAIVPDALPLGLVDVVVTRGEVASNAAAFEVVEQPTPLVTSVQPDPLSPGVIAIIEGMHLGTPLDDVSVSFGGADAEKVLPLGKRLVAKVPANATTGLLTVTVNGVTSDGVDIEVVGEQPAPELTSVTPAAASPGSLVEIDGEHLFVIGRKISVSFGTARAAIFGRGESSLIAVVPKGADGDIQVEVGGQSSNGLVFEVLERGLPQIDALEPSSGKPLDRVDIQGTDLYDLSFLVPGGPPSLRPLLEFSVTFGDARAFLVFPTVEGLRAVVPLRAETGDVVVTVDGKRSNAVPFTVDAP